MYWGLDRPSHRVLLSEVQALRCSGRLHVMAVLWVVLVVVVLPVVVPHPGLLEGPEDPHQPRLELPEELEVLRHLTHQPNPEQPTFQVKQVDELASEREKVDATGGVEYTQAKRYGSERRPAY